MNNETINTEEEDEFEYSEELAEMFSAPYPGPLFHDPQMTPRETIQWINTFGADAEVWEMTGTRQLSIGEPSPEEGEAKYIGTAAQVKQQYQDLIEAL